MAGAHCRGLHARASAVPKDIEVPMDSSQTRKSSADATASTSFRPCGSMTSRTFFCPEVGPRTRTSAFRSRYQFDGRELSGRSYKNRCARFSTAHCLRHSANTPDLLRRINQPSRVGLSISNVLGASCICKRRSSILSHNETSACQLRSSSIIAACSCTAMETSAQGPAGFVETSLSKASADSYFLCQARPSRCRTIPTDFLCQCCRLATQPAEEIHGVASSRPTAQDTAPLRRELACELKAEGPEFGRELSDRGF